LAQSGGSNAAVLLFIKNNVLHYFIAGGISNEENAKEMWEQCRSAQTKKEF